MSGLFICDISDHLPVFTLYTCDFINVKHPKKIIVKRTRTEDSINNFNNSLEHQDWSAVYNEQHVDSAYGKFLDIFLSLYEKHCPTKEFYIRKKCNKKTWITKGIINACKKKNNLYKRFIKLKTNEAEKKYKRYRNKLTDVIRTSKELYYQKRLNENRSNVKETWNILNSLIKKHSPKSTYPDYFVDKKW